MDRKIKSPIKLYDPPPPEKKKKNSRFRSEASAERDRTTRDASEIVADSRSTATCGGAVGASWWAPGGMSPCPTLSFLGGLFFSLVAVIRRLHFFQWLLALSPVRSPISSAAASTPSSSPSASTTFFFFFFFRLGSKDTCTRGMTRRDD